MPGMSARTVTELRSTCSTTERLSITRACSCGVMVRIYATPFAVSLPWFANT